MKARTIKTESIVEPDSKKQKTYKLDIVWFNAIGFAILHLATLYGWYLMLTGEIKGLTLIWGFVVAYTSSIGTTMGAHRLFTHKCYKANLGVRAALIAAFTMAGQNCLWVWARDHRQHHKYSDTDGDPHNASRGFFFSHIGWLMVRKQPEVITGGKTIDMSDLNADPLVMFQKKYYKTLFTIFSIGIPTLVPCYFWNEDLFYSFIICFVTRLMTVLNGAWCVNSLAHIYGNRPFSKDILPTENAFVSFISSGEGWHNYHHSFPWDYKAAEIGQHYNFTATAIELCAKQGWTWDLKFATPEMVRHRIMKRGDGTHRNYVGSKKRDDSYTKEDADYEILKREAETKFTDKFDDNNNEMLDKNNVMNIAQQEEQAKLISSLYKLVE